MVLYVMLTDAFFILIHFEKCGLFCNTRAGHYVIPSIQKFDCPSVSPSVCLSVCLSALRFHSLSGLFWADFLQTWYKN